MGLDTAITIEEMCGLPGGMYYKINLILPYSMRLFQSAYELFCRVSSMCKSVFLVPNADLNYRPKSLIPMCSRNGILEELMPSQLVRTGSVVRNRVTPKFLISGQFQNGA